MGRAGGLLAVLVSSTTTTTVSVGAVVVVVVVVVVTVRLADFGGGGVLTFSLRCSGGGVMFDLLVRGRKGIVEVAGCLCLVPELWVARSTSASVGNAGFRGARELFSTGTTEACCQSPSARLGCGPRVRRRGIYIATTKLFWSFVEVFEPEAYKERATMAIVRKTIRLEGL